jgi:transcription initiation factor TFIIIB Brf1 subunit/transcription initiation factor TFIIB
MSENLSCPFCGCVEFEVHNEGIGARIGCVGCGVLGDGLYADVEDAWRAWNRPRDRRNAPKNDKGD